MNATVFQLIVDCFAIVDLDFYKGHSLIGVFKDNGIFGVGQLVVTVCCIFFDIQRSAHGDVRCEYDAAVHGTGSNFKQRPGRDFRAVSGGQLILCIQAKGHSGDFAVTADAKEVILLHILCQRYDCFLAFIDHICGDFRDFHFLPRIGQFHILRLGIQYRAVACLGFHDGVLTQIQLDGFHRLVCQRGNGIHDLALGIAENTAAVNILGGNNVIDRTGQTLHFIYRLVHTVLFRHSSEYFAGLADLDNAFLRHIGTHHFNDLYAILVGAVIGNHIKIDGCGVKHIIFGCGYLHKIIALAVFQRFGGNQEALIIGVEGRNLCDLRIGVGHCDLFAIRGVKLKAHIGTRDDIAAFRIGLYDFDAAFKYGIVGKIMVGASILGNEHFKIREQFSALFTGYLMHYISAVREQLCFGKAVLIADKIISLAFLGILIAAGGFQIDLKFCTDFRSFDLCGAVICVFNHAELADNNTLCHIQMLSVQFHRILLTAYIQPVDFIGQKITAVFRCGDLTDVPVIAARIVIRNEIAVFVGHIGVNERFTVKHTIGVTGKSGVALCFAIRVAVSVCGESTLLGAMVEVIIDLKDFNLPFLQNVLECHFRFGVPFNNGFLRIGNHILLTGVYFFNHIRGIAGDQHIFKDCHAVFIGFGKLFHSMTTQRGAGELKLYTGNQIILGVLNDFQGTTLQDVVKVHGCSLATDHSNSLAALRLIKVRYHFGYSKCAGTQAIQGNHAAVCRLHSLVDAIAGNVEGYTVHHAILGGLNDFQRTSGCFHIQICDYGIGIFHARDYILQFRRAIGDQLGTFADNGDIVSCCCDCNRIGDNIVSSNGQRVAGLCNAYAVIGYGNGVLRQHIVGIGQSQHIFSVAVLKFLRRAIHKAGNRIVVSEHRHDLIVGGSNTAVGVVGAKVQIIYGGINLSERTIGFSASGYKLPDQCLRCHPLFIITTCQAVAVSLIAIQKCQSNSLFLTA